MVFYRKVWLRYGTVMLKLMASHQSESQLGNRGVNRRAHGGAR